MKLLDTNILVYAAGEGHPYKQACAAILAAVGAGAADYAIDVELMQEILHLYTRRRERLRGLTMVEKLLALFPSPLPITAEEYREVLRLMARYHRLGPRDAVHAAVVITHRLEGLVSTDQVFDDVAEIRRFSP